MNAYAFQALDARGRRVKGVREAASPEALRDELERDQLVPLAIAPSRQTTAKNGAIQLSEADAGRLACDLARYLRSGLSLVQGLSLLEEGGKPATRRLVVRVRERVTGGEPLSAALDEAGGQVGRLLQTLARAGEATGRQAEILDSGGRSLVASAALKRRLLTLSLYPAFVMAVALGAVVLYAYAVLPALEPALAGLSDQLPWQTALVLQLGRVFRAILPLAGAGVGAFATAFVLAPRVRAACRELLGRIGLSKPGGGLLQDLVFAGVARRLAISLEAGVPLLTSYAVSIEPISFASVRRRLEAQEDDLRDGVRLSDALAATKLAPADLVRLARVGEQADELARVLGEAGDVLAVRTQEKVERLLAAATPLIVVVIGVLVGAITIMVFQGLLAVTDAVEL